MIMEIDSTWTNGQAGAGGCLLASPANTIIPRALSPTSASASASHLDLSLVSTSAL